MRITYVVAEEFKNNLKGRELTAVNMNFIHCMETYRKYFFHSFVQHKIMQFNLGKTNFALSLHYCNQDVYKTILSFFFDQWFEQKF